MPTITLAQCASDVAKTAFQEKLCAMTVGNTETLAGYYDSIAKLQYFTDFNPLTVDWTTPVPWGNDPDNCKMGTDSGCLMPNWAGLYAPARITKHHRLAHLFASPHQSHYLWLWRILLACHDGPNDGTPLLAMLRPLPSAYGAHAFAMGHSSSPNSLASR